MELLMTMKSLKMCYDHLLHQNFSLIMISFQNCVAQKLREVQEGRPGHGRLHK